MNNLTLKANNRLNSHSSAEDIKGYVERMERQIVYLKGAIQTICKPNYGKERSLSAEKLRQAEISIAQACSFIDGVSENIKRKEV